MTGAPGMAGDGVPDLFVAQGSKEPSRLSLVFLVLAGVLPPLLLYANWSSLSAAEFFIIVMLFAFLALVSKLARKVRAYKSVCFSPSRRTIVVTDFNRPASAARERIIAVTDVASIIFHFCNFDTVIPPCLDDFRHARRG